MMIGGGGGGVCMADLLEYQFRKKNDKKIWENYRQPMRRNHCIESHVQ